MKSARGWPSPAGLARRLPGAYRQTRARTRVSQRPYCRPGKEGTDAGDCGLITHQTSPTTLWRESMRRRLAGATRFHTSSRCWAAYGSPLAQLALASRKNRAADFCGVEPARYTRWRSRERSRSRRLPGDPILQVLVAPDRSGWHTRRSVPPRFQSDWRFSDRRRSCTRL